MAVSQYIGARYVPIFVGDWDITKTYEPLSIVLHNGNSYTSVQSVPSGIDIEDTGFWAETGNYNAQVEGYRKEVLEYSEQIASATEKADSALEQCLALEPKITANTNSIKAENARASAAEKENADDVTAEVTRAKAAENALGIRIDNIKTLSKRGIVIFGDSWTTYHDKVFMTTLANLPNVNFCKCYGVSGAKVGDLPSQVANAKADGTLDVQSVTDVFVIIGTNNVYWDSAVSAEDAYAAFLPITQYFTYAKLHWFPNNSRTNNSYRNSRYTLIGTGAANAGFATHYESLCIPYAYNTSNYPSLNLPGYQDNQHLTNDCSKYFITQCLNLADGGNAQTFNLRLSFDTTAESCWSGSDLTNAYYHGNFHNGVIELQFAATDLSINTDVTKSHFYAYSTNSPLQGLTGGSYNHGIAQLGSGTMISLAKKAITEGGLGIQSPIPDKSKIEGYSAYIQINDGFLMNN